VLFIGDIFGAPGRKCLNKLLPSLKKYLILDLVVANGENASGGLGLSQRVAQEIFIFGVDVITSGNHVWKQRDLIPLLEKEPHVLRPANYPVSAPGQGWLIVHTKNGYSVAIVNLEGRTFMNSLNCPFMTLENLLVGPLKDITSICVDMHAEASSEKQALAWYFKGRISAVLGTHTHVQTADERILTGGTAYITDLGMTGAQDSVIGMNPTTAIERFISQRPTYFKVAKNNLWLMGAVIEINPVSGRALSIERVCERLE